MVEVFYRMIKSGKKTIEDVPTVIRAEVQALLDKDDKEN